MIHLSKIFILFIILDLGSSIYGQNLYDENNTQKFADFLFNTQQFDFASQEYERLVFMNNHRTDYKLQLIRSYRLNNQLIIAENRFLDFYKDSLCLLDKARLKIYFAILFSKDEQAKAQQYLNCNSIVDTQAKSFLQTSIYLLDRKWNLANSMIEKDEDLKSYFGPLAYNKAFQKHKSPFLAASLSILVPGLGKVYTGFWKDGLISFLFVAANSFQAYRSFSKYGVHQTFGWVFGGFALGFYSGNIYGSIRSAKKFNFQSDEKTDNTVKNIIFSGLD